MPQFDESTSLRYTVERALEAHEQSMLHDVKGILHQLKLQMQDDMKATMQKLHALAETVEQKVGVQQFEEIKEILLGHKGGTDQHEVAELERRMTHELQVITEGMEQKASIEQMHKAAQEVWKTEETERMVVLAALEQRLTEELGDIRQGLIEQGKVGARDADISEIQAVKAAVQKEFNWALANLEQKMDRRIDDVKREIDRDIRSREVQDIKDMKEKLQALEQWVVEQFENFGAVIVEHEHEHDHFETVSAPDRRSAD